MIIADNWRDFELLDAGSGEKLERWGRFVLRRPDPQAIWPQQLDAKVWNKADAWYHRSSSGGGDWEFFSKMPERWKVSYPLGATPLQFYIKTMGFKHTGLFPEQAVNWQWIYEKIRTASRPVRVLNLFSYTGAATVAAAAGGAGEVVHVDASKGMVRWAKENLELNNLTDRTVRFLTDDVIKFVKREIRRERKYDAIIMDPPSYGRGPNGEKWDIENDLFGLVSLCVDLLSSNPLFFLINSYTTGLSGAMLKNILALSAVKRYGGYVSTSEIGLQGRELVLPCGHYGRWEV